MRLVLRLLIAAVLCVPLLSCGGGGGGGGPQSTIDYQYAVLELSVFDGGRFRGSFGGGTLGGGGSLNLVVTTNSDGVVGAPQATEGRHVVGAGGRVALSAEGTTVFDGFQSDDGAVTILATTRTEGIRPAMGALVRRDRRQTTEALVGIYHRVAWHANPTTGFLSGLVGRVGIGVDDVLGGQMDAFPGLANTVGDINGTPEERGIDFEVVGGALRAEHPSLRGGATPDSEFIFASGSDVDPLAAARVRAFGMVRASNTGSPASLSTLSGRYGYVQMGVVGFLGAYATSGILVADGAGGLVESAAQDGRENVEGRISVPTVETRTGAYTVLSDGTLTLQVGGRPTVTGGVSPSGRYAVLGGPSEQDALPELWLLVRLPNP